MVNTPIFSPTERGSTMIEVLVTLVIIAFGLLGLAGLQTRMQVSEVEAYQRSQALLLLNDMASRLNNNRANAGSYVTSSPLGVGATCPTATTSTVQRDLRDWCNLLQGAAETETVGSTTSRLGAMIGARGCVQTLAGVTNGYLITVAWQGLIPISAPASTCGQNSYNGPSGAPCQNDLCRRVVTTTLQLATLSPP